jgi:hypothetical protein
MASFTVAMEHQCISFQCQEVQQQFMYDGNQISWLKQQIRQVKYLEAAHCSCSEIHNFYHFQVNNNRSIIGV